MKSRYYHAVFVTLILVVVALLIPGCQSRSSGTSSGKKKEAAGKVLDETTRTIDQTHIRIDVEADFQSRSVRGLCHIDAVPLRDDIHEIGLHTIDTDIDWVKLNDQRMDFTMDADKGIVWIQLDRGYDRKESLAIDIQYESHPSKGMFFYSPTDRHPEIPLQLWTKAEDLRHYRSDTRYWVPCYDLPDDRMTSEILLTVPAGLAVSSNGKAVAEPKALPGNRERHHWRFDHEHVTYLIAIDAGQFDVQRETVDGIHYGYFVPPGWSMQVKTIFGRTPTMMKFFSDYTGLPYPYSKYDQVVVWDFVSGGMEHTTKTTLIMSCLHDDRGALDYQADGLIAHELVHMWFGDYLTCRTFQHITQNEGFASYFTNLWFENKDGYEDYQVRMNRTMNGYASNLQTAELDALDMDLKERYPVEMQSGKAYSKGSSVLHMLRFVLGDDNFRDAVRLYVKRHGPGNVTSEDWRLALEEVHGESLQWFFKQWYYEGVGAPQYRISWGWDEVSSTVTLHVNQDQRTGGRYPIYDMPVNIEITAGGQATVHKVRVHERDQTITLPCSSQPDMVIFDKGGWLLKTLDFEKSFEEWRYQLQHGDVLDRSRAVRELGRMGARSVDVVVAALSSEKNKYVREDIVRALDSLQRGEVLARLQRSVSEGSKQIQTQFGDDADVKLFRELHALQLRKPDVGVVSALLQASADVESKVRLQAVIALSAFDRDDVRTRLQVMTSDDSYQVQIQALSSLAMLDGDAVATTLQEALNWPSHRQVLARRALWALFVMEHPKTAELAFAMAMRPDDGMYSRVEFTALDILRRLQPRGEAYQQALRYLLQHPSHRYRRDVINRIRQDHIIALLSDVKAQREVEPMKALQDVLDKTIKDLEAWMGVEVKEEKEDK